MLYLSRTRFVRLVVQPLMLLAFLSGCSKWVDVAPPFADAIERNEPSVVRLTVDDVPFTISKPAVVNDSIVGQLGRQETQVLSTFAVNDIQRVEVQKIDAGQSLQGVVIVLGVLGLVAMLSLCLDDSFSC